MVNFYKFAAAIMQLLEPETYNFNLTGSRTAQTGVSNLNAANSVNNQASVVGSQSRNLSAPAQTSDGARAVLQDAQQEAATVRIVAAQLTQTIAKADAEAVQQIADVIAQVAVETVETPAANLMQNIGIAQNIGIVQNVEINAAQQNTDDIDSIIAAALVVATIQTLADETAHEIKQTGAANAAAVEQPSPPKVEPEKASDAEIVTAVLTDKLEEAAAFNQPLADQTITNQTITNQTVAEQTVAEQTVADQTAANQPTATPTLATQAPVTQAPAKQVVDSEPSRADVPQVAIQAPVNQTPVNQTPASQATATPATANQAIANLAIEQTFAAEPLVNIASETSSFVQTNVAESLEQTNEVFDFWDLFPELNPSEIKYFDVVAYLYGYMASRNMLDFLNPEIDLGDRLFIMTKVTEGANKQSDWEEEYEAKARKQTEDQINAARDAEREDNKRRALLRNEFQHRSRIERQRLDERLQIERRREDDRLQIERQRFGAHLRDA